MLKNIIINSIFIVALSIFQLGFVSALPQYLNTINLVIVISLFILVLNGLKMTIIWVISIGFIFDIFEFKYFGIHLITLSLAIYSTYFLLRSFFTDRSLYSFLALTFFATLFYDFFLKASIYLVKLFYNEPAVFFTDQEYLKIFLAELIMNFLAAFIIFHFVNYISHQLKPVFLGKKSNL